MACICQPSSAILFQEHTLINISMHVISSDSMSVNKRYQELKKTVLAAGIALTVGLSPAIGGAKEPIAETVQKTAVSQLKENQPVITKSRYGDNGVAIYGEDFSTSTYPHGLTEYKSTLPVLYAELAATQLWKGHKIETFSLATSARDAGIGACCWEFPGNPQENGNFSWMETAVFLDGKFLTRGFGTNVLLGKEHLLVVKGDQNTATIYGENGKELYSLNDIYSAAFLPDRETILLTSRGKRSYDIESGVLLIPKVYPNEIVFTRQEIQFPLEKAAESNSIIKELKGDFEKRLGQVLANLKNKTFESMISDDSVVSLVGRLFNDQFYSKRVNWDSRFEILYNETVDPLKEYYGDNYYYQIKPIGEFLKDHDEIWDIGRKMIMEKARSHLKNSDNLWSLYTSKKPLVVAELKKRAYEEQEQFKAWLGNAKSGLEVFLSSKFQKKYPEYLKPYDGYSDDSEKDPLTPDVYATMFAGRRFKEGGRDLVKAYIRIADDLLNELQR